MNTIQSFKPIVDEHSKILILGSIPGVQSLIKHQYYGNDRNQFWTILYTLFKEPLELDYKLRKQFLLEKKIALWDVIADCQRKGSLDSDIKNENVNNFADFFKKYPKIETVFFNGKKASNTFKKKTGYRFEAKLFHVLPSTSPAYTIKLDRKIEFWKEILEVLESQG